MLILEEILARLVEGVFLEVEEVYRNAETAFKAAGVDGKADEGEGEGIGR